MKLSKANLDFLDNLFDKLMSNVDTEMIDLQDDDACDDHLQFEKLLTSNETTN